MTRLRLLGRLASGVGTFSIDDATLRKNCSPPRIHRCSDVGRFIPLLGVCFKGPVASPDPSRWLVLQRSFACIRLRGRLTFRPGTLSLTSSSGIPAATAQKPVAHGVGVFGRVARAGHDARLDPIFEKVQNSVLHFIILQLTVPSSPLAAAEQSDIRKVPPLSNIFDF
jgi:hypothetical protein